MKFNVNWSSPYQGIQNTTVDAINPFAAREQIKSMYAHVEEFRIISISPMSDEGEYSEPQRSYSSSNNSSESGTISSTIGGLGFLVAGIFGLLGLFSLPVGIIAMVLGGAVGWIFWKAASWLDDRGW